MCFILGWRESTQDVAADTAWFSETQLPTWHYAMKRHNTIATFLYKLLPELPFSSYFLKVQFKCLVAISFQWPDDRKDLQTLVIIYTNFKFQVTATVQHIFSNLDCLQYLKKKKKKSCIILSDLRERQDSSRLYFSHCERWEESYIPLFFISWSLRRERKEAL